MEKAKVMYTISHIQSCTEYRSKTNMKTKENNTKKNLIFGISAIIILSVFIVIGYKEPYQHNDGNIFNTSYHITYQSGIDYKTDIEKELQKVDASLSMFNDTSIVSRLNKNQEVTLNGYFTTVFNKSQEISRQTKGDFDITVAPLVNVWNAGNKEGTKVATSTVDSIKSFVGYQKIYLINGKIIKKDPRIMMDFSAIAKGYGADVVAMFLQSKGIKNYIVDIGGKIDAAGKAPQKDKMLDRNWCVSIKKPFSDSLKTNNKQQIVLKITDTGMATRKNSGTTIDPHSGQPVNNNLLSVTVLGDNCMTANAYATSFIVMGMDKAVHFLKRHKELKAYFIYKGRDNKEYTYMTPSMHKLIAK